MKRHRRAIAGMALLLAGLLSCASAPVEQKAPEIVWPLPPDEPRVKYVRAYSSSDDVEPAGGIASAMFGEENRRELRKPYGVAVDSEGTIYVTDIGVVFVFDRKNKKLRFIGDAPGVGKLKVPIGITVSRAGRVYVTDTSSDRVFVYSRSGSFIQAIGVQGELEAPAGVVLDEKRQRLYVADSKLHVVRVYDLQGRLLSSVGKRGVGDAEFNFPTNVALDADGNLYVVDTVNHKVKVFDPDGKFLRAFGALGDLPGNFVRPKGVGFDSEGHVYVVDAAFQNFQIFNKEGRLMTFVGEGGTMPGQFMIPAGLAVDDEDRIYVADQLNRRVQVFEYLGNKWKKRSAAPKP